MSNKPDKEPHREPPSFGTLLLIVIIAAASFAGIIRTLAGLNG